MTDGIHVSQGGTMFAGEDAVDLYRAAVLKGAIGLLTKGISPTRGLTMKRALALATEYTGTPYKRTQAAQAITDLAAVIEAKRSTIPVTRS